MVALTRLIGFVLPCTLVRMFRTPQASSTSRTPGPALTPVPGPAGAGSSRLAAGRLAVTARFADILRAPSGSARLSLNTASFGTSELGSATLSLDAPRPGRFVFQADAKGQPLTVALAGDGAFEPGRTDLRLTRLAGSLGGDRLLLEQPLTLTRHGGDLSFSGLALDFGTGRITGAIAG